jgi:surface protein
MKQTAIFLGFFLTVFVFISHIPTVLAAPIVPNSFSTTWSTGDSTEIIINLGTCPDTVYWESLADEGVNGTSFACAGDYDVTIDFTDGGEYRVDFSGSFSTIILGGQINKDKFRSVEQWGDSVWVDLDFAFENVTDLAINAADIPDLSSVTNLEGLFQGATNFNSPINNWDVSNVTDMGHQGEGCASGMFQDATSFNQPLNSWNVAQVTDFSCMFNNAAAFNQPLGNWNMSSAIETIGMFEGATSFNQPLNNWDTSNVIRMYRMFLDATSFNQPLNNWDTANVTSINSIFAGAISFNQDISAWDVSGVTYFTFMFDGASAFDQSLANWVFNDNDIFTNILTDSGIGSVNYAATLEWWASLNLMPDTEYGRENIGLIPATYCDTAQTARDTLVANGWIFSDEGVTTCVAEEVESSSNGSSATRVGERAKSYFTGTSTSTSSVASAISVTKESFIQSVRNFIEYLTKNEADLEKLTPEESTKIIVGLRDILVFLLTLLPGI